MRIVELQAQQHEIKISANDKPTKLDDLHPMELLATALAKDILMEIQKKVSQQAFELKDFSVRIVLRKNTEKAQSKIVETYLELPQGTSQEIKTTLQKLANKSHIKRLLSNEILFEPSSIKE